MILRALLLVGFLSATITANAQQLASEQDFPEIDASVSADGRYRAFVENVFSVPGNDDAQNFVEAKLYLADSLTNTTTTLYTTDKFVTGGVKLSADGRFVAFHEADNGRIDLYRYEISTGEVLSTSADDSGVLGMPSSVMSSDGRYFVYTRKSLSSSLASHARNITLYLFDAETETVEAVGPQCSSLTIHSSLTISSEGGFFSYESYCVDESPSQPDTAYRVHLYDIANKSRTRIDPDSRPRYPRISKDGRYIRFSKSGGLHIYDRLSTEIYPFGVSTECVDSDGDGWGYIEYSGQSCQVDNNTSATQVASDCDYSNADRFNGWGWNPIIGESCVPLNDAQQLFEASADDCDYSNADKSNGWGWNPTLGESCAPVTEQQQVVEVLVDECDYSNADNFGGWGWNPVAQESCSPVNDTQQEVEDEQFTDNPSIGCNYYNADAFNGWGWNPITQESCAPTSTVDRGAFIANELIVTRETINNLNWPESGGGGSADISANGRYITFTSQTLSPSSSDQFELFVRDTMVGLTRQLLPGLSGVIPDGRSSNAVISADGRFVAFSSHATNLTAEIDTNGVKDIFVIDLQTNVVTPITHAEESSYAPDISHDGRYVSFMAESQLTENDQNNSADVYVHDRLTGNYTLVGVTPDGVAGERGGTEPKISGDGRFVLFESKSSDFGFDDRAGFNRWHRDIFLYDLLTGETRLLSADDNGAAVNDTCDALEISANGSISLFRCEETSLAEHSIDDNMYIYNQETDSVSLLYIPAVVPAGAYPRSVRVSYDSAVLSDDGRYVVFNSLDRIPSVTPDTTDSQIDRYRQRETHLYRHDRVTNTTEWLAKDVGLGGISADGRYLAFNSSENLTANDANRLSDIYRADFESDSASSLSTDPLCTTAGCTPFGIDLVWDGDISYGVITDVETLTEAFYDGGECDDPDGDGFGWQQPQGTPGRSCSMQ